MRRKEVTRPLTSIAEVRASLFAHRNEIGRLLDERPASPEGGGFSQAYFDQMDAELATVEGKLVAMEDEHVRKEAEVAQARRLNAGLVDEVYTKQTSARQVLVGVFGPEHGNELAVASGDTPQGPMTLPEQVGQTVKFLRDPAGETPSVKIGGVALSFAEMADDLEDGLKQVRASREAYDRRRKEADATRLASNDAITEVQLVFPWVASSLEGLFRLVGERELADRIRTSARRVTRRQEEKPEEASSEGSTSEAVSSEASISEDSDAATQESQSTESTEEADA